VRIEIDRAAVDREAKDSDRHVVVDRFELGLFVPQLGGHAMGEAPRTIRNRDHHPEQQHARDRAKQQHRP
jgi:hypothetical protein